jgi:hypothetical protein
LPEFGAFGTSSSAGVLTGNDVLMVNSTSQISDAMCSKINEVLGVSSITDYVVAGDITGEGVGSTVTEGGTPDLTTTVFPSDLGTIMTMYPQLEEGGVEGVCIQDTGVNNQNTFAFYVQEL